MHILGIETSCDETAAAVVKDGRTVLSNIVVSSLREHARYGGIIPEIASRRQLECINSITKQALTEAKRDLDGIDAIAVTHKPGLIGSLLVGTAFARSLSFAINKPLVNVDHIKAHIYANFLEFPGEKKPGPKPQLPAVALVVSGGHTDLYHVKDFKRFRLLGRTLDDAAGEAFDKVAKILDLGFPGGPAIDRVSKEQRGPKNRLRFKGAALPDSYNFSFSGVKTAVLYHCRQHQKDPGFSVPVVADAFQNSITSTLTDKCMLACKKLRVKNLLVGGGVASNSQLRQQLLKEGGREGICVHFPPMSVCQDNAAMIAGLGYHLIK